MEATKTKVVPTFSGKVTKKKVKPMGVPTFVQSAEVVVQKAEPEELPAIGSDKPKIISVAPYRAPYDKSEEQQIYQIKKGREMEITSAKARSQVKSNREQEAQNGREQALPGDAKPNAQSVELGSWEEATFPTWTFWGTTTVHVYNIGTMPVTVRIQGEYFYLDVGEDQRKYGQWGGVPVTIGNMTQSDQANGQDARIQVVVW